MTSLEEQAENTWKCIDIIQWGSINLRVLILSAFFFYKEFSLQIGIIVLVIMGLLMVSLKLVDG